MEYRDDITAKMEILAKRLADGSMHERVARSVQVDMARRIFEDGKASDGSAIGQYDSTKDLYVAPAVLPRKIAPRGKRGRERQVQDRKTVWFPSYKSLRSEQGREAGKINLRLTGDLLSDFCSTPPFDGAIKTANPLRISTNTYAVVLRRQRNIDIKNGVEKRFGAVFSPTATEEKAFTERMNKEILLALA